MHAKEASNDLGEDKAEIRRPKSERSPKPEELNSTCVQGGASSKRQGEVLHLPACRLSCAYSEPSTAGWGRVSAWVRLTVRCVLLNRAGSNIQLLEDAFDRLQIILQGD